MSVELLTEAAMPSRPSASVPRQYWLAFVVAVVVPLLLYLPTLGYGFIYDDLPLVARNEAIRSMDAALGYFGQDFDAYTRGWEATQSNYYRPLVFVFMALLWPWAGDDPSRWHALIVVLNALVGGLAFVVIRAHGVALGRALFGALLFSLHPLHVHSAAWITGMHDILAAGFVLLGYFGLSRWLAFDGVPSGHVQRYVGLTVFVFGLAAALLTKESGASLALLAFLLCAWTAFKHAPLRWPAAIAASSAMVLMGAYLLLRWRVLGGLAAAFPSAPAWPEALASIAPLVWAYSTAWIWPVDLSLFSSFRPLTSVLNASTLIGWPMLLLLVGALIVLAKRRRDWLFPLLFFACFLAPHLNLRALNPEWAMMHRYLYLPSLGLAWMLALLPIPAAGRRMALALAVVVLALLAAGSLYDMRAYRDEQAFWDKALRKDPHSSAAWTEQGRLFIERGDRSAARDAWQRASDLNPNSLLPRLRLGNLQFAQGEYAAAAATYRAILARSNNYPPAWRNLSSALLGAGDREGALGAAQEAQQRFPRDAEVLASVGTVRKLAGDLPGALAAYSDLVQVRPTDAAAWLRLASLQVEVGRIADARHSVDRVRALTRDGELLAAAEQLAVQIAGRQD